MSAGAGEGDLGLHKLMHGQAHPIQEWSPWCHGSSCLCAGLSPPGLPPWAHPSSSAVPSPLWLCLGPGTAQGPRKLQPCVPPSAWSSRSHPQAFALAALPPWMPSPPPCSQSFEPVLLEQVERPPGGISPDHWFCSPPSHIAFGSPPLPRPSIGMNAFFPGQPRGWWESKPSRSAGWLSL